MHAREITGKMKENIKKGDINNKKACNIPKFSPDIWNIRVLIFLNELSK